MENNNLALSKRARSTPAPNETVCTSIAAARAPHTPPCTIDDKLRLHTPVNKLPEPTTLRRLTICVVQRCLRVLSGARHQQTNEDMGSGPAAAQKPVLHWQPHECLHARHINSPHKRSLKPCHAHHRCYPMVPAQIEERPSGLSLRRPCVSHSGAGWRWPFRMLSPTDHRCCHHPRLPPHPVPHPSPGYLHHTLIIVVAHTPVPAVEPPSTAVLLLLARSNSGGAKKKKKKRVLEAP